MECACEEKVVRKRPCAGGSYQWVRQCLRCGACSNPVRGLDLKVHEMKDAEPPDDGIRARWLETRRDDWRQEYEARRAAELEERRAEYREYLLSPWWRARRALKLERQPRCQAELPGCTGRATEVHHVTYRRRGREPLFDLRSVCAPCHREIHQGGRSEPDDV